MAPETVEEEVEKISVSSVPAPEPVPSTSSAPQPTKSDDTLAAIKAMMEMYEKKSEQREAEFRKEIFRITDCEAIWNNRDNAVRHLCEELGIELVECISHTLWDPSSVIKANGGHPPLTYEMFLQVSSLLGLPPRPSPYPDWSNVMFGEISDALAGKLGLCPKIPTPEELGFFREREECITYVGGETAALKHLEERLRSEEDAFRDGYILPNQVNPDLLGPPMSMSAALKFGCLSVRK
ncbi:cryptochrome-1-like [Palaemon carinicauda]|uniref:cryptochrome-1-like n=1 Tax=Palaemon carinicauda TaxID=392227 RepID=UPI0035B62FB4